MNSDGKRTYERKTKTAQQALSALMRYAARAERSSGDAMRLMRGWGVPESDMAGVLAKLTEHRFIDDTRFAEAYVRDKSRISGWGVHKIRAGLRSKGIPADIIARSLSLLDEDETAPRLEQMLWRKWESLRDENPYQKRAKLIRLGLSRGYEYSQVSEAVDRVVGGEPDGTIEEDGSVDWE